MLEAVQHPPKVKFVRDRAAKTNLERHLFIELIGINLTGEFADRAPSMFEVISCVESSVKKILEEHKHHRQCWEYKVVFDWDKMDKVEVKAVHIVTDQESLLCHFEKITS